MVELQKQRVEHEITMMIDELDKRYLRKMEATMHRCAANCCDNVDVSLERVRSCVEDCSTPMNNAQKYVQNELERLQTRLQRCVMECNDKIKDKVGPNPSEAEVNKYSLMFENCAIKCVDTHIDLIPALMKSMRTVLSKQQNSINT